VCVCVPLLSHIRATCPAHSTVLTIQVTLNIISRLHQLSRIFCFAWNFINKLQCDTCVVAFIVVKVIAICVNKRHILREDWEN
jgi:hypothetical protein